MIATLAERGREEGLPVTIVTGDRDAFQLIDPRACQGHGHRRAGSPTRSSTTARRCIERYGIPPELIPDFYGLKGDTSDNIPGVPGIGDKTARELLQRFGDLETVLGSRRRDQRRQAQAEPHRARRRRAHLQAARDDQPRGPGRHDRPAGGRRAGARPLEAARGLPRVRAARPAAAPGGGAAATPRRPRPRPQRRTTLSARRARGRRRPTSPRSPGGEIALADAGARGRRGRAVHRGDGVALRRGRGRQVLVGAVDGARGADRSRCGDRPVLAHDVEVARRGPGARSRHDTLLGAYLLEPARRAFPFGELCEERGLRRRRRGRGRRADAVLVRALAAWQREQIEERGLRPLLDEIELPLVDVLRGMEVEGVRLNTERLAEISRRASSDEVATLEREIWDLAGDRVHDRLAAAARRDPVQQARPVEEAPRQDRLLDRRARAAGDPRRARDRPEDRALARAQRARQDLPRRAARAGRRRARASTRRSSRPAPTTGRLAVDEPEPAERPDPHRARARDPRLLRGRGAARPDQRRLLAGRAARSSRTSPASRC